MARSHAAQLAALVAQAAADAGLTAVQDGQATVYLVLEELVVVVTGAMAEFRLRADVAAAAARTPEAAASPRGPEWVAFSPTTFDRFTRDRIASWAELAVREASR